MTGIHSNSPAFDVVDETDDWIVVSKAAPLIVHPTDKKGQDTLLGGLEQLLIYDIANGAKLSIINRLDRETSGLVLVAKNKTWARAFSRAMERRSFKKSYLAILKGVPSWSEVGVDAPIGNQRDVEESKVWLKQSVHQGGRASVTHFRTLETKSNVTLVEVTPKTGRMHQIRVHAAHLGYPLVGDKIYQDDGQSYIDHIELGWTLEMEQRLGFSRHALHASQMEVEIDGVNLTWSCPLALDMKQLWDSK